MPAWKLLALYAAWLLASATIAIVAGGFVGILLDTVTGGGDFSLVFNIVAIPTFVVLAAMPYLLRNRTRQTPSDQS